MTKKLVAVQVWFDKAVEGRRDAGQGTLEYVGMIIVAALVVVAVAGAVDGGKIAEKATEMIDKVLNGG